MKIINKLAISVMLVMSSMSANALITSGTDGNGTKYYYTSFPMPSAKWKTKIAIKRLSDWQWVVAVPFYYYGNSINSDIMKLRDYMNKNNISYRDGICTTFPYTQPCLF